MWIAVSVPETGAGISVSTLSVEMSTSGSSFSTWSPTCFRHSSTVPSVTDSPIAGIVIWTVVPVDIFYTGTIAPVNKGRRHWGWGFQDARPARDQITEVARLAAERLGFEPQEIEDPAPLEAVELPSPRIRPPEALAGLFADDGYERATHSY